MKKITTFLTFILLTLLSFAQKPDSTFGIDAKVVISDSNWRGYVNCMASQPDGKLLLGAQWINGPLSSFGSLIRLMPDGSVDSSFAANGVQNLGALSGPFFRFYIHKILLQPDGKILAIGNSHGANYGDPFSIKLFRFNTDGALDVTFFNNGIREVTEVPVENYINDAKFKPDGKLVLIGNDNGYGGLMMLARMNSDYSMDSTFGLDGFVRHNYGYSPEGPFTFDIQPDGKIVAGGHSKDPFSDPRIYVFRFNENGSLDSTFGVSTYNIYSLEGPANRLNCIKVLASGKILLGGNFLSAQNNAQYASIIRLNPNGEKDVSYQSGGECILPNGLGYGKTRMVVADDDIVYLGGYEYLNPGLEFNVLRILPTGYMDAGAYQGGFGSVLFPGGGSLFCMILQQDGKLVLGGKNSFPSSQSFQHAIARFLPGPPYVGIELPRSQIQLNVWPNPIHSHAVLSFSLDHPLRAGINVYDVNGRIVQTISPLRDFAAGNHEIPVIWENSIPAGIYWIAVETDEGISTLAITKQ